MTRANPSDLPALFAATFSSGNRGATMDLYMPDAVLIDQQGAEQRGRDAISKLLRTVLASGAAMSITPQSVVEYGCIALLRNNFEVKLRGQILIKSTSFELLYLDGDSWKLAVDCPYGQMGELNVKDGKVHRA